MTYELIYANVFNQIAEVKSTIDSLKTEAEHVKREGDFNKAAEIVKAGQKTFGILNL